MEIFWAVLAGGFIGAVLGFVGAGGAMISVPILIYGFNLEPKRATVAALAIVFLAALSGASAKARKREILYKEALTIWAIGSISNIYLASRSDSISEHVITTGFALVLIVAGVSMLFPPRYEAMKRISWPTLIALSLVIGSLTGLFGIGGGFLAIPVLVLAFNTPQSIAAGTSLVIIALNCLTALLAHYQKWSEVRWSIPLVIAISAVIVAQWASHRGSFARPEVLRRSFALLLCMISAFTLLQTWL